MFKNVKEAPAVLSLQQSKIKVKFSSKEATYYLFRCFRLSGLYRTENNKIIYYIYSLIILFSVTLFLPFSFVASYSLKSSTEFEYETLLTSIQVAINVICSAMKVCALLYYIPSLIKAEPIMAKLDARCLEEDEISALYKLKSLCSRLVIGFTILYESYATCTFLAAVLAGHPPYSLYLPWINWRNSKWEFTVAAVIEWILMGVCCFQEVANDVYGPVYVCILRTHVNNLRLRISKLCSKSNRTRQQHEEDLKLCIIDHKNIIDLYNIVAPVISTTIFMQFTLTAGILGITLINIMIFARTFSSKLASAFYFISVVVEIFALCYYSTCLMYDSNRLSEEIFHSSWTAQNMKYRKMMIFFMQRTQQSVNFWAGKIFLINLNSFVSIAKFSLSLYTLIKKMNLKEKLGLQ